MKNNLISVIMSVYNEDPRWLREAVESILNQTYKELEFIIIMDNPNNLALIEILEEYAKNDSRIKLFINQKNMGLVYSLNRALKYASGAYIARMDADDISYQERLKKQLNYLQTKNLDLIGTNIRLFRNGNDYFYESDKLLTHKYLKKMLQYGAIGIVHPTFFGKKEMFENLNGYKNVLYAEDMEFLSRALCRGYKVGNMQEILLDCRYRNDSITKTYAYVMHENTQYITNIFKRCLKTENYDLYPREYETAADKEKNFNTKQILLAEARAALGDKKYIKAIFKILIAIYYSRSTLYALKINLALKILKILETRNQKREKK
ncbi:MAG: glycosyltransferase [Sulfurovum sp.]|nr:glycosyltransferase [Sulfurovum sp.]MCB4744202.1 glycosyltransferase [Sulfurovum sp.]MCB4745582.1 glycosyltransferase [Sulfurovum sp.]MCB4747841.1 glycosyltransferase [Sulfurovum sp.]MCB4749203.1 glycosyltransferase [Sulfurovum sp.]